MRGYNGREKEEKDEKDRKEGGRENYVDYKKGWGNERWRIEKNF